MPAICQSIHHCIFQRITDSACIGWIFGYVGHYSSMSRKYHDMLRTGAWYLENISWYVGNRCLISWYVLKIFKDIMICWEPVPDILKISWYFSEKTRAYQKISWYFLATWWDIAEYQKNQKISWYFLDYSEILEHIRKYQKISWYFLELRGFIRRCIKISKKISWYLWKYRDMIRQYHGASVIFPIYFDISGYLITAQHIGKYKKIEKYDDIFRSIWG